jgi:hypothetical protein
VLLAELQVYVYSIYTYTQTSANRPNCEKLESCPQFLTLFLPKYNDKERHYWLDSRDLRGIDGDLLREGVVLGVDLGVDPADKSPRGRDNCLLRSVSFSSGTANNNNSLSGGYMYLKMQ